jgi:Saxitoxin biosynthesis operon protein SxtJ
LSQNIFLHEDFRDEEPTQTGSNRRFGCTVGAILIAIGIIKVWTAQGFRPVSLLILSAGALLVILGMAAPSRLAKLNKLWSKLGTAMGKVVNPIILALLFFLVVTPMALLMRIVGRRPLRLAADHTASSYWILREKPDLGASMTRQF